MFYPEPSTRGCSHGLGLYAPFYIAARLIFEPFAAETAALLAVMVLGAVSLYALLRRFIGATVVEAVVLTVLFSSSGNVINDMMSSWAQRGSVPALLLNLKAKSRHRAAGRRVRHPASARRRRKVARRV